MSVEEAMKRFPEEAGIVRHDVGAARGSTMVAWRILDQPRLNLYVNL
jgi:hypothetical protein